MLYWSTVGAEAQPLPAQFFVQPPSEIGPLVCAHTESGALGSQSLTFVGRDGMAVYSRNWLGQVRQTRRFLYSQACQVLDDRIRVKSGLQRQVQFVDASRRKVFALGWDVLSDAVIVAFVKYQRGSGRSARVAA